ncbi:hypothetical protein [Modestobacter sp. Leaf380]|uniref:hypothetical protein n=1 Tax=Modestobacter sp. Leaf380 TaxID=1736356 RepID=UPI000700F2C1|nr:hypothetical protein [Modestobacter sp. Leaf380]KQS69263.1 hypothetical protein ASG41_21865 [Modestobacter sp. Leaf380]
MNPYLDTSALVPLLVCEASSPLCRRLGESATASLRHGLRGRGAVHCAGPVSVADAELAAATGDRELLTAWRREGLSIVGTGA